jgi:mannose-6-phosphate isomerase-like protein (cupin superfamily)
VSTVTTVTPPTATATTTPGPYVGHAGETWWFGDSLFEFLIPNEATNGQLAVFRATMPEGFSPPRHIHTREDEVFMIEQGELCFDLDGKLLTAGAGTTLYVPRGVPHTFRVAAGVAQVVGIMTPGEFTGLFRTLGFAAEHRALPEPGSVPLNVPAVMAEQLRRGTEVVGPPMQP